MRLAKKNKVRTGISPRRKNAVFDAFLVAHNPRLTALIERGMSEPGGIPLAQVEREVSRRARRQKSRG